MPFFPCTILHQVDGPSVWPNVLPQRWFLPLQVRERKRVPVDIMPSGIGRHVMQIDMGDHDTLSDMGTYWTEYLVPLSQVFSKYSSEGQSDKPYPSCQDSPPFASVFRAVF